ncbi:MAG: type IV secretory system conjugative DNA transfer family protein [Actinomycetota bacterium]|nr:type IV secretory system conjugative DNA transfer family protein [Actinomycetota bacterium]
MMPGAPSRGVADTFAEPVGKVQDAARAGRGLYIGLGAAGWAWAGAERAMLVLGPSRSGKTSALVVPNVLSAPGAVVATSTKPDVLRLTAGARSAVGWCLAFDPTGRTELPPGVHRVGWSPVHAASTWHGALGVADAMVRTARGRPSGALGAGAEGHWTERAGALLAPLLHAASLDKVPMRKVLHWVDRHDGVPALDVLAARLGDDAVPTDLLAGILSTDEREQSGIWSTASGILAAYRSPGALASTEAPLLDADEFCNGPHTLYVCAPAAQQQLLAPLVVAMLSQVRDAAYRRASRDGAPGAPSGAHPVVFALDEVANIAPLPDLPSLVTEGPGQGLLTLACLQDLSQARARWGEEADAFVSLFGTTVVLGGIADRRTLEGISALGGDREVRSRAVGFSEGAGGRQVSATDSAVLRRRLPVDVVARGARGWALCVDARNRLGWVRLTPAHETWPWRACVPAPTRERSDRSLGSPRVAADLAPTPARQR